MATYQDAKLVLELTRWSTEMGLDDALTEVFAKDFDASNGSSDSKAVRKVLWFGETVGSLVKHGVLDWDLLSDLFDIGAMWKQVAAHARNARDQHGEPRLYEHFEAMASRS